MAIWTDQGHDGFAELRTRIRRVVGEGGYPHLVALGLHKLAAPLCEFGYVEFYRRELEEAPAARASGDFQVRFGGAADLERVAIARRPAQSIDELRARFERGDLCVLAVDAAGAVVHSRWLALQRTLVPELDAYVVPASDEAYFYDGYTHPKARGRGVDGLVRDFIFRMLLERGRRRAYSYVRGDNPVGRRAAARAQTPVGGWWYLRFRGFRPLVFRGRDRGLPSLRTRADVEREEDERRRRVAAWRRWFESWLGAPAEKHSTGYHSLPPEYFESAASYIVGALALDAACDAVLDVGCNSAMLSRRVAPHTRRFVGIDLFPGMLAAIPRSAARSSDGRPADFIAADGTRLPLPSRSFDKAYCTGVIHTLPSAADGIALIDELVRVCRPGGLVHVGAVPDIAKRWRGRVDAFRSAGAGAKLRLLFAWLLPARARRRLRSLLGLPARDAMAFIEYDLGALKRRFELRGLVCEVADYPRDYWSRDFRRTRSNLLIRIPGAVPKPAR